MKKLSSFWGFYSNVYDILNQFQPYQKHLDLMCFLLSPQKNHIYLDAGCGTGNLSIKINKVGAEVIGIDYSNEMLARASEKNKGVRYEFADLDKEFNFNDDFFDGVVSNNVIAYLKNPRKMMAEVYRVLKPGSFFIVATLKDNWSPIHIYTEHYKQKGMVDTLRIFFPLLGLGICNAAIVKRIKDGAYHTYNQKSFAELMQSVGFSIEKVLFSYADQDVVIVGRK